MIFLSTTAQHYFETSHLVILCVSMPLNLVSLFFLIHETPPYQAKIRNYLLLTQVIVIVNAAYMDLLFSPIPLFPAPGGICSGILCRAGISMPPILGGLIITYAWLVASYFLCCFFRHQTLLPESSHIGKSKTRLVVVSLFLALAAPSAIYGAIPFDLAQVPNLLITSKFDLEWVLYRGPYFMHDCSPTVVFFMVALDVVLVITIFAFLAIFSHIYYVLHQDKRHSSMTIRKIRRSLFVLFIQAKVNLFLFSLMLLHPIVHNLILLGITPTYRRLIKSLPRRIREKSQVLEFRPCNKSRNYLQSRVTVNTVPRYR